MAAIKFTKEELMMLKNQGFDTRIDIHVTRLDESYLCLYESHTNIGKHRIVGRSIYYPRPTFFCTYSIGGDITKMSKHFLPLEFVEQAFTKVDKSEVPNEWIAALNV